MAVSIAEGREIDGKMAYYSIKRALLLWAWGMIQTDVIHKLDTVVTSQVTLSGHRLSYTSMNSLYSSKTNTLVGFLVLNANDRSPSNESSSISDARSSVYGT